MPFEGLTARAYPAAMHRRSRTPALWRICLLLLALPLALPLALAQPATAPPDDLELEASSDVIPAVAAFGVTFGLPAYRTAGVSASVQAQFVGGALRAGYGSTGVAVGAQVRAYPPVPWPLPTFVGAGADLYGGRFAPHLVLGTHVPVAERWRLDVEAGVAWAPLLDEVQAAPFVTLGASYAFAVGVRPRTSAAASIGAGVGAGAGGGACGPVEPDGSMLGAAVDATVKRFVDDATATYGSVYRGLRYRVSTVDTDVQGDRAEVVVTYDGRVVERLTGRPVTASGEARLSLRWNGCRWLRTGLSY